MPGIRAWSIVLLMGAGACNCVAEPEPPATCTACEATSKPTCADAVAWDAAVHRSVACPPDMVGLTGGTFWMGSPPDEAIEPKEPYECVTLSHDFCVARMETTREEWIASMGALPHEEPENCDGRCPVLHRDWADAAAFANARSRAEGLDLCYVDSDGDGRLDGSRGSPYHCQGYRLPTSAEWEYAARSAGSDAGSVAGSGGLLVQGTGDLCEPDVQLSNGATVSDFAWFCGNASHPRPVGVLRPNAAGLYDMNGNTWEWNHNWFGNDASSVDPVGPAVPDLRNEEGIGSRAMRGGSWRYPPRMQRMANAAANAETTRNDVLSFRLVRTAPSP